MSVEWNAAVHHWTRRKLVKSLFKQSPQEPASSDITCDSMLLEVASELESLSKLCFWVKLLVCKSEIPQKFSTADGGLLQE